MNFLKSFAYRLNDARHRLRERLFSSELRFSATKENLDASSATRLVDSRMTPQFDSEETIVRLLRDDVSTTRVAALRRLQDMPLDHLRVLGMARPLLRDANWQVRQAAAFTIGSLEEPAPEIVEALMFGLVRGSQPEQDYVRSTAAQLLREQGEPAKRAIPLLVACVKEPPRVSNGTGPDDVNSESAATLLTMGEEGFVATLEVCALTGKTASAAARALYHHEDLTTALFECALTPKSAHHAAAKKAVAAFAAVRWWRKSALEHLFDKVTPQLAKNIQQSMKAS